MEKISPEIQLVITAALKKEMPKEWFAVRDVPVYTMDALKSGALGRLNRSHTGILVIITGAGLTASEEAACWIRDNLNPLFVLNIGTCGITDKRHSPGRWITPRFAAGEDGDLLELDTGLPVPHPEKIINVDSLLSVKKASAGNIPSSWKKHDILDMECLAQAKIFRDTRTSFHCLKFVTDYSDSDTHSDFNRNLELFVQETKRLFSFLDLVPSLQSTHTGITAVVPVYNREKVIRRALDSILSQSCPPDEIVVVNDCSTDRTLEILESYGQDITAISTARNSGPSKARNEGTRYAHTEWIAFMDSDDCWEKDKLKGQIAYLKKYPFYQIMQSEEKWIRNGKRVNPRKHHKKPLGWIWGASLERCLVSPSGVLIKKSLLEQYGGFDENLPVCEDYDLWLRISRYHPAGLDPSLSVIKYGGHEDQLSRAFSAMDRFRVRSLARMLQKEPLPLFRQQIAEILRKKLGILIQGYEKRGKTEDALECREILNSPSISNWSV